MATLLITFLSAGCSVNDALTGIKDGQLPECPSSPNCVSTQSQQADKKMSSLPFFGDRESSKQKILVIVNAMSRSRIISETADYVHVEFRSALFRFVDDVEFFFDEQSKAVHFRSASRTGYSDMGVNRKRMSEISKRYLEGSN